MYLQILLKKIAGPIVQNTYDMRILNVFESNSQRQMPDFNNHFRKINEIIYKIKDQREILVNWYIFLLKRQLRIFIIFRYK